MMNSVLCLTFRFLDPVPQFHGRGDGEKPEWPPSPLRIFQALVSAAASLWPSSQFKEFASPALQWLEEIQPLMVTPPTATKSFGYRMYVPNNSGDLMTAAWARGDTNTSMAKFRVEKDVRPIHLNGDTIHFVFPIPKEGCPHFETLRSIARSVTYLGWGINPVAGNATLLNETEMQDLRGEVWQPTSTTEGVGLRTPICGTLTALLNKHQSFLERIGPDGFKPVPPLSAFRVVGYRRTTEAPPRPFAAFSVLKPDASSTRSFDTPRRTRELAGMLRHAIAKAAREQGWSEDRINVFVHGKTENGTMPSSGATSPARFQYLPLPTINFKLGRVESIRRLLVCAPSQCSKEIRWVTRALAGAELSNEQGAAAMLTILPGSDWVLRQYTQESASWSTVTPVILPGFDDPAHLRRKMKKGCDAETQLRYLARLDARTEELVRKSMRQAGYSSELVELVKIEWGNVGFRAGVDLASQFLPPANLNHSPRIHVRLRFPHAICGPIAIGSGRFRGFGLFASENE